MTLAHPADPENGRSEERLENEGQDVICMSGREAALVEMDQGQGKSISRRGNS